MLDDVLAEFHAVGVAPLEVYSDIFNLGFGLIQQSGYVDGGETGIHKANPIILGEFGGKIRRKIMFEDTFADTLAEFQQADWAILNGLTYWGRANKADAQSKMCAMIFDLDGVGDAQLRNLLFNCNSDYPIYPTPNYVIMSGHNVHLYYVLDEPIDLYPNMKRLLKDLKYRLTDRLWNPYTSTEYENVQHQGINQGFRVIGGKTKNGGIVRAFRVNEHPFTVDELNDFLPSDQRIDFGEAGKSKHTIEEAKELFPEWYQRVVLDKEPPVRRAWPVKEDLYRWWLRKVREGATFRHRYFCLMALAIFATKCGITDRERVKADMESLVPFLNTIDAEHPFGNDGEVDSALECLDLRYVTFPRNDIEKITAIQMPPNKRNGRTQAKHLQGARAIRDINNDNWREGNGRKPKCDLVRSYAAKHPEASQRDIAAALGISKTTVNKWLKSE